MNKVYKFLKDFFERFVMIYGYSMLATLLCLYLFNPGKTVGMHFFLDMILFSMGANLPPLIYCLKEELLEKLPISPETLCMTLELFLLIPLGYYFELWKGWAGFVAFIIITISICLAFRFSYYTIDSISAKQVMDRINEMEENNE
ncbi:MAG: hypothetical protein Q4C49_05225 [Bacillota bacterium]|nr:hypothetical protein [Bacillota bacterium]